MINFLGVPAPTLQPKRCSLRRWLDPPTLGQSPSCEEILQSALIRGTAANVFLHPLALPRMTQRQARASVSQPSREPHLLCRHPWKLNRRTAADPRAVRAGARQVRTSYCRLPVLRTAAYHRRAPSPVASQLRAASLTEACPSTAPPTTNPELTHHPARRPPTGYCYPTVPLVGSPSTQPGQECAAPSTVGRNDTHISRAPRPRGRHSQARGHQRRLEAATDLP